MTSHLLEELPLSLLPIGIGFLHFSALLDELANFSSYLKNPFFFLISTLASEFPFPVLIYIFYVSIYHHVAFVIQHKGIFTYSVSATWMLKHAKVYMIVLMMNILCFSSRF